MSTVALCSRRTMRADGLRDLRRREPGHGDLVEQRLERVMVRAVDERDPHRRALERLRGGQAAEAARPR